MALWNGQRLAGTNFTAILNIHGAQALDCSGVLIAPQLVLTAGHCLYGARNVTVRFPTGGSVETISATRWLVNPSWNAGLSVNGWDAHIDASNSDRYVDLAVVLLSHAPSRAMPIELTQRGVRIGSNSLLTYGYARGIMLEPLNIIDTSNATMLQRLSPRGPFKLLASGGSAWCQGDSGGPVTRMESDGEKLVGIVGLGLGAVEHNPADALAARWGSVDRIPKCGNYAYVQDVNLHAAWIASASAALMEEQPYTASINVQSPATAAIDLQ